MMKKTLVIGILEVILILIVCSACEKRDSEISSSDSVEYLEVIKDGETIEGLDVESDENIWGQITDIDGEGITIKICKKVIDENAPNGWYVEEIDEKKTLVVSDDVQVWVMQNGQYLDSRIAYTDIKDYEKVKSISIIWSFDLDDEGDVEFIYEPLIP